MSSLVIIFICFVSVSAKSPLDADLDDLREELASVWDEIGHLKCREKGEERMYRNALGITQHEDGFNYNLAFISKVKVRDNDNTTRSSASGIYHLASSNTPSDWFKYVQTAGLSFWHRGSTLIVHMIHPDGTYQQKRLGNPFVDPNAEFQVLIPEEVWHAIEVDQQYGSYVLETAVMVPGYGEPYWILGDPEELNKEFPQHSDLISRFA